MTLDLNSRDKKTVPELFDETLTGDYDDESSCDAVWDLIRISTPEVFETAMRFCNSTEPLKKARGFNILAHFGCYMKDTNSSHLDERITIALEHLSDKSEIVVESAAWALSHMKSERTKNGLLTLQHHTNADVRHAVAAGLAGENSPAAIDALIGLMHDSIDYVRDWATFSLGREYGEGNLMDSPKIREAFHDRLSDADENTRSEAIWALAIRKDMEGLKLLLERLKAETWVSGDEEAAIYLLNMPGGTPVADLCNGLQILLTESEPN